MAALDPSDGVVLPLAAGERIAAALAQHQPCHEGSVIGGRGSECSDYHPVLHRTRPVCVTCRRPTPYPCPTALALGASARQISQEASHDDQH